MGKEIILKRILFVCSFLLTIWGVVGIIYTGISLKSSQTNSELYGHFFEIVVFSLEVFSLLIAFLYIKFKKDVINVISLVYALLIGIIFLAEIFILAILIYGAIKGTSLETLTWFDWTNFVCSILLCGIFVVVFYLLYRFKKAIEKDKKENLSNCHR